jgi:tetratricopeptide (TPR) repeat protein
MKHLFAKGFLVIGLFVAVMPNAAQAIPCDPSLDLGTDVNAYLERASACLELEGRNPEQALADANSALMLAPDNADAYAARAWSHVWQRSFGQAIADATVAITLEPDNDFYYRGRAFAMLQVDDLEGALADMEQAIVLAPNDTDLYLFRSDTLEDLGRMDEAIAKMQQAVSLFPNNAELIQRLGDLYFVTEQDLLAFDTYNRYKEVTEELSPLVNARLLILERRLG